MITHTSEINSATDCPVVVVKRTKDALMHIYNKMSTARRSASNLPKLLSVLDILTPNERRFLQSILANLPPKTLKDLGCYSYIFEIISSTIALPYWYLDSSPPYEPPRQWHGLESPLRFLQSCMPSHGSYFDRHATYRSEITGHVSGMNADVGSLRCLPWGLQMTNTARSTWDFAQPFELSPLQQLRLGNPQYRDNYRPLYSFSFELFDIARRAAKGTYTYDTSAGSYEVSVVAGPAMPKHTESVVVMSFIISRVKSSSAGSRRLEAEGWLTCSSFRKADSESSVAESDTLVVRQRIGIGLLAQTLAR